MLAKKPTLFDSAESKQRLIKYFVDGCKRPSELKIGTESESFLYEKNTGNRLSYEGKTGIKNLLEAFSQKFGWEPIYEKKHLISLKKNSALLTLEPGGQLELSGAPHSHLHSTYLEVKEYFSELSYLKKAFSIQSLALGVDPFTVYKERPWVEKERYVIMRDYMSKKGNLGLEMMTGTATIQSNLDFTSEQDMATKLRLALSLQPIIIALFATSPFSAGKLNGFQSYRSYIWQHTDPDRCGWMPWVFTGEMNFEKYVDYLLDVPMYFIQTLNGNKLIPAKGQTFREFAQGKLENAPGLLPTIKDWETHIGVVFPEVRLKKFLEMRGADAGPVSHITALSAIWTGLLYDNENIQELSDTIKNWTNEDRLYLYTTVPKKGLKTEFKGEKLQEWAKSLLNKAMVGLKRRNKVSQNGEDESVYLSPLLTFAQEGENLAAKMIKLYETTWKENINCIFNR